MKVYYDPEHNACSVEFDADDTIFMDIEDGKMCITSLKGGKPEMLEKQLLFSVEDKEEQ